MINYYIKLIAAAIVLSALIYWFPTAIAVPKLALAIVFAVFYKLVFFDFVDFRLIYKKARETATGAGLVFIASAIFVFAFLDFLK